MKVKSIETCNIKGAPDAVLDFGKASLLLIEGANGTGKSSYCDAVRMIFEGGSDPGWLRSGEPKGYVRMLLEDGTEIKKTVSWSKKGGNFNATLEITDPHGALVAAPQTFVNRLASAMSVNPALFLELDTKRAAEELLKILPVSFSAREIEAISPQTLCAANFSDSVDLRGLANIRSLLYDARKVANKLSKDTDATITQLTRSLPDAEETNWADNEKTASAERAEILTRVEAEKHKARQWATAENQAIVNDINARISALHEEKAERMRKLQQQEEAWLSGAEEVAKPDLDRLAAEITTARERADQQRRTEGVRQTIEQMRAKGGEAGREATRLDRAIDKLDTLKMKALADLPITGLEFTGDEFTVDGVPWEHVNTARKIDVALQVAALKAGDVRLMVIDNAEHLDKEYMEMLKAGADKLGLQVIAARVTDTPLTISPG